MAEAEAEKRIGSYEIESELGRGAFGVVYKAFHTNDPDTWIALKVVETSGKLDRVMREPALLAKLDHPCVVRVLDYFPHGADKLAIALEFIDGNDLKTAIETSDPFPPAVVLDLLLQIGGASPRSMPRGSFIAISSLPTSQAGESLSAARLPALDSGMQLQAGCLANWAMEFSLD